MPVRGAVPFVKFPARAASQTTQGMPSFYRLGPKANIGKSRKAKNIDGSASVLGGIVQWSKRCMEPRFHVSVSAPPLAPRLSFTFSRVWRLAKASRSAILTGVVSQKKVRVQAPHEAPHGATSNRKIAAASKAGNFRSNSERGHLRTSREKASRLAVSIGGVRASRRLTTMEAK